MIWYIVIGVVAFFIIRFVIDLNKDNYDLQGQTLSEKFKIIVEMINFVAYGEQASVTVLDKRSFNLYKEGANQIVMFRYSTGILTIIWKYKFFQKEVVYEKTFENVRNLSIFEQEKIGTIVIEEMHRVVEEHQRRVLGGL